MAKEYRFIDKDPIIDIVRTAVFKNKTPIGELAKSAHVTHKTIANWLYGDVKRPQHWTTFKVLRALGVDVKYYLNGEELEPIPYIGRKFRKAA